MIATRFLRCVLFGASVALLGLGAPMAAAAPEPSPSVEPGSGAEPDPTAGAEPAPESPPPEASTSPPIEPQVCEPACPAGASCYEGQCFVACDPAAGECTTEPAAAPPAESETEPEVEIYTVAPPEPEPEPEPAPHELIGLGLRIAPGASACLGEGCRRIQVGDAGGSMGAGGGLDVRLVYRATPHLSLEVGGLVAFHGNDIDADPLSMWGAALLGPRLHLSGGRWRAEPVLGMQLGYVRSLVRWTNAGVAGDGLALGADGGVALRLTRRLSASMVTGVVLPYWTRVCDADHGITDCYSRSELTSDDLRRFFWTTSLALLVRFS